LPYGAVCVCFLANWQALYQISGKSQEKLDRCDENAKGQRHIGTKRIGKIIKKVKVRKTLCTVAVSGNNSERERKCSFENEVEIVQRGCRGKIEDFY
jgi:hypothetical protein